MVSRVPNLMPSRYREVAVTSVDLPLVPERLKELQKTFHQHARDEKTELLPAVQRALSEEQVQGVAEKMEAGLAEAEQARQDEAEERRAKARQEREEAEFLARLGVGDTIPHG